MVVHTVCMLSMYHGYVSWLCIVAMYHGYVSRLCIMAMYHGYVYYITISIIIFEQRLSRGCRGAVPRSSWGPPANLRVPAGGLRQTLFRSLHANNASALEFPTIFIEHRCTLPSKNSDCLQICLLIQRVPSWNLSFLRGPPPDADPWYPKRILTTAW